MAQRGRAAPAQARAREYLAGLVKRASVGDRLPNMRQMAREAGTACASMQKAVRYFVGEGIVSARRGAGVRVERIPGADEILLPNQESGVDRPLQQIPRERFEGRFRRDILGGHFAFGTVLPAVKELCERYGVSYATMRTVLKRLAEEELLEPHGRGYRTQGPSRRSGSAVIALVAPPVDATTSPAISEISRAIRLEAAAAGVEILVANFAPGRLPADALRRLDRRLRPSVEAQRVLGVVAWACGPRDIYLDALVPYLMSLNVPVALADDEGTTPILGLVRDPRFSRFAAGYTSRSGEIVGRYLVAAGHRRVAYITPDHSALHSRNRLEGLSRVVSAAEGKVTSVPLRMKDTPEQFPWKRTWPTFERALGSKAITSHFSRAERDSLTLAVRTALFTHMQRHEQAENVMASLGQTLADTATTAWVAVSDTTARVCLEFLRRQGIAVPRDLCVVGFDDSREAAESDLTSYNVNGNGIARAMLQAVLRPRRIRGKRVSTTIDIDGYVVGRGSAPADFCPQRR